MSENNQEAERAHTDNNRGNIRQVENVCLPSPPHLLSYMERETYFQGVQNIPSLFSCYWCFLSFFFFCINFIFIRIKNSNLLQTSRHLDDWNHLLQKDVDVTSQANWCQFITARGSDRIWSELHTHTHTQEKEKKSGNKGSWADYILTILLPNSRALCLSNTEERCLHWLG